MLWTIAVILLVLWTTGLVSSYTMGGFIHFLLVLAILMVLVRVIQGRASRLDSTSNIDVRGSLMKHTAWALYILGLFMFAVAALAEDSTKTEKKEEREVTPTKSTHKVESKTESRRGSDTTTDQKTVQVESHKRANGMTETETTTTTKHKVESKTKEKGDSDTTINEKTVESGSKKRADGLTETQTTTTTTRSAPHTKTQKSTTKERTLENSEGKVLEHEKTTK